MLDSEQSCIDGITNLVNADFSLPLCQRTFDIIVSLYSRNIRPTFIEILKEGRESKVFTPDDTDDVKHICTQYTDEKNTLYWIKKVKTRAKLREMDDKLKKYSALLTQTPDNKAEELLQNVGADFAGLSLNGQAEEFEEPKEFANFAYEVIAQKVERYRKMKERYKDIDYFPLDGVPTGFPTLDFLTLGYKPGDLIILGAQTGHGKTAFAIHSCKAAAVDAQNTVAYINTEMSREQIALRWGAVLSGIPHEKVRKGALTDEEVITISNACGKLSSSGWRAVTAPNLTPIKLRAMGQRAKIKYDVKLIILDYVGRLETKDPRRDEWEVLYEMIKTQKIMAQNLECAVMCLVQLNPDGTLQGAKRMKNECDLMLKLKPLSKEDIRDYEEKNHALHEPWNYMIEIDKSRDSRAGVGIPINFDKETQRMWEAKKLTK